MGDDKIKVLVLAGHYMPNLGYQENGWIKALVHYGLQTKVVARPDRIEGFRNLSDQAEYRPGIWKMDGYELQRMALYAKFRSMAWPRGIKEVIRDFAPDVVIAFGVGQILPAAGVRYKKEFGYKLICLFGDNSMQRSRNHATGKLTLKGKLIDIAFRIFKRPLYVKTIKAADTIGYNTDPATRDFLRNCLSPSKQYLMEKMVSLPLGFDGDIFYYSSKLRAEKRSQLGFKDSDRVLIYVSRIQPRRHIEELIQNIETIMRDNLDVKFIIVGILGDPYGEKIKQYITELGVSDRVRCLKLADRNELNVLYNAADIGVWHLLPTITLVESLGTGLPIVIPDDPSFSPNTLPKECIETFKLRDQISLRSAIIRMLNRMRVLPDRNVLRAALAKRREYKQLVCRALDSVGISLQR